MKKGELALTLIGRPGKLLKHLSNPFMMHDFIGFGNNYQTHSTSSSLRTEGIKSSLTKN